MRAVVHGIEAHDIPNWPDWSSNDATCELQWFTVHIGPESDPGTNLFQVVVATPLGVKAKRTKGKFSGLVVDRFEPTLVEHAIRDFVEASQATTWEGIIDLLRAKMHWEYEGMGPR